MVKETESAAVVKGSDKNMQNKNKKLKKRLNEIERRLEGEEKAKKIRGMKEGREGIFLVKIGSEEEKNK